MKPYLRLAIGLFFLSVIYVNVFSQETQIPKLLQGIWENDNRILTFHESENTSIFLKLFYGWYYDRSGEPILDTPERPKNNSTSAKPEQVSATFEEIIPETEISGAWNINLYYKDFNTYVSVPVAIFEDKLYLDFMLIKPKEETTELQASSNASGIKISPPIISKEVYSLFDTGNALYKIRYWETGMDYDNVTMAVFTDQEDSYNVPKHIKIGQTIYTCVPGRGTQIRNIQRLPRDFSTYIYSPDNRICATKEPYLTLFSTSQNSLYSTVEEANKRQRPPRKPPLPKPDVDFHYDEIENLRKNTIIPMP